MICSVHALVGAAIGRLLGRRDQSLAAGVATHLIGDLLPHKDFDPKTEAALLATTMGGLALKFGVTSPEFIGAAGAIAPDIENAASSVGLLPADAMRFPTHLGDDKHGPKVKSAWPQGVLAAICLLFLFWPRSRDKS